MTVASRKIIVNREIVNGKPAPNPASHSLANRRPDHLPNHLNRRTNHLFLGLFHILRPLMPPDMHVEQQTEVVVAHGRWQNSR